MENTCLEHALFRKKLDIIDLLVKHYGPSSLFVGEYPFFQQLLCSKDKIHFALSLVDALPLSEEDKALLLSYPIYQTFMQNTLETLYFNDRNSFWIVFEKLKPFPHILLQKGVSSHWYEWGNANSNVSLQNYIQENAQKLKEKPPLKDAEAQKELRNILEKLKKMSPRMFQ